LIFNRACMAWSSIKQSNTSHMWLIFFYVELLFG
jgi:hypothetical protein